MDAAEVLVLSVRVDAQVAGEWRIQSLVAYEKPTDARRVLEGYDWAKEGLQPPANACGRSSFRSRCFSLTL